MLDRREQEKRDREKERLKEIENRNVQAQAERLGFTIDSWFRRLDADDPKAPKFPPINPAAGGLMMGVVQARKLDPGIYSSTDPKYNDHHLYIQEGGRITPIPYPDYGDPKDHLVSREKFKQGWDFVLDAAAAGLNATTMSLDFGNDVSLVKRHELEFVINMIEEKGNQNPPVFLKLDFGKTVEKYLTYLSKKERELFLEAKRDLDVKFNANRPVRDGHEHGVSFKYAAEDLKGKPEEKKLLAAQLNLLPAGTVGNLANAAIPLVNAILKGTPATAGALQGDARVTEIDKQLDKLTERLQKLSQERAKLDAHLKGVEDALVSPLVKPHNLEVSRQESAAGRNQLITALDAEMHDIEERRKIWEGELTSLRNAPPVANPPTPAEVQRVLDKATAMATENANETQAIATAKAKDVALPGLITNAKQNYQEPATRTRKFS